MDRKVLYPIDRASFRGIRQEGFLYVDKTAYIDTLVRNKGKYYFLARPRRFGKSLFLDTLAEFFSGNRALFKGLAIDTLQPQEWETYPVLRFNLSGKSYLDKYDLKNKLNLQLELLEKEFNINQSIDSLDVEERFLKLITNIKDKTCKDVVILIDEYDAPLSSSIDNHELQKIFREQLHGFYSLLKGAENMIRFCMLTGVTRYGKVSVFSGLNNLKDITFSDEFAAVCGITKNELALNYQDGIEALALKKGITIDETFELLKFHYDGYHFSESMVDIYNPFSINNAFYENAIDDYWCQSGTPTLLAKSLMKNDYDIASLNGRQVEEKALTDLSMEAIKPIPLFYQTGYLTLKAYDPKRGRFTIGYPNREVEAGILNNVLSVYLPDNDDQQGYVYDMEDFLEAGNPEAFIKTLKSFLSGIPSRLHAIVDRYENYYHTIFYCLASLLGLDVHAEYATSEGSIDILVKTESFIYIIELKVNGTAEDAIRQIEQKHYSSPFEADGRRVFKIGLGFSKESATIESAIIL